MQTIEKILKSYLLDVSKEIQDNIISSGREATGKTRKSIRVETRTTNDLIIGTIYGADHIENLETGTPPKQGFTFMDTNKLADDIFDWAKAKPVQIKDGNYIGFSFRTANLILSEGSRDFRNKKKTNIFSKEVKKAEKEIPELLKNATINIFVDTIRETNK